MDSSLVATLMQRAGAEVVGIHMIVCGADPARNPHAADGQAVADRFGFEYHVLDLRGPFREQIVEPFIREYLAGRTPNPCARCNRLMKLGLLLEEARRLGAEGLATGHYARTAFNPETGRTELLAGADPHKEQSYYLFTLGQDQLRALTLPLGGLAKTQSRELARDLGIPVHDKPDSLEICFVPGDDYRRFLDEEAKLEPGALAGPIIDTADQELGRHEGIHHFTIGQRKGMGIAAPRPLYVVALDAARKAVVAGYDEELLASEMKVEGLNWISLAPQAEPFRARVKIRYRGTAELGTVHPGPDGSAHIVFDQPVRAITPGQAAVAYDEPTGQRVLAGGWIGEMRNEK